MILNVDRDELCVGRFRMRFLIGSLQNIKLIAFGNAIINNFLGVGFELEFVVGDPDPRLMKSESLKSNRVLISTAVTEVVYKRQN